MVMAAGLGTRMRPLTNTMPKALVPLAGKPLIAYVLDPLVEAGVERIVVNVHAHADQLEAYLRARKDAEFLISDERRELLETGGGVKHAQALLGEAPIFRCNSDYVWKKDGALILDRRRLFGGIAGTHLSMTIALLRTSYADRVPGWSGRTGRGVVRVRRRTRS